MHQGLQRSGHEAVIDEDVFLDAELAILLFEIAGTIVLHAMTQYQVLALAGAQIGSAWTEPALSKARFNVVGAQRLWATAKRRRSSTVVGIPGFVT
jgi:hypothetical protein